MDTKKIYTEYIELSQKISNLESEKKIVSAAIVLHMQKEKVEKVEADNGFIKMHERKSYIYTDAVKDKAQKVKDLQKKEVEKGLAEEKITPYLRTTLIT